MVADVGQPDGSVGSGGVGGVAGAGGTPDALRGTHLRGPDHHPDRAVAAQAARPVRQALPAHGGRVRTRGLGAKIDTWRCVAG